jgi:hypothetical protein
LVVKVLLEAHSNCDWTILSKSVSTLLINDAINQIEALFNKTKINAEIVDISK